MPGPHITKGDDNQTPTTATTGPSGQWGQPVNALDGDIATLGAQNDAAATSDTGTFSLVALFKRLLQKLTAGVPVTNFPANQTVNGTVTANQGGAPWSVTQPGSAALYPGTLAADNTAKQLQAASQACSSVLVQNDPTNTVDMLVGGSAAQTIRLMPGMSAIIPVDNVNKVYAKTVSGTGNLNWLARS